MKAVRQPPLSNSQAPLASLNQKVLDPA